MKPTVKRSLVFYGIALEWHDGPEPFCHKLPDGTWCLFMPETWERGRVIFRLCDGTKSRIGFEYWGSEPQGAKRSPTRAKVKRSTGDRKRT